MADLNMVTLVGRLTRDAELKYTSGGTAVARLALAVNRRVKRGETWEDDPSFFDATLWGPQAERLQQYLLKGQQIAVSGELHQQRWDQDGERRSRVEIIIQQLQLLGGSRDSQRPQQGPQQPPARTQPPRRPATPQAPRQQPAPAFDDGFDDDILF